MKEDLSVRHEFVEFIPDVLKDRVLYVSIPYKTAVHRCCCGCGNKVVTPLAPRRWKFTFDGETISLHPSIGNWSFPCRSHYFITNDSVEWAGQWSQKDVEAGRAREDRDDKEYFESVKPSAPQAIGQQNTTIDPMPLDEAASETSLPQGIWGKFTNWVRSKFRRA